jgi:hypothetical protein
MKAGTNPPFSTMMDALTHREVWWGHLSVQGLDGSPASIENCGMFKQAANHLQREIRRLSQTIPLDPGVRNDGDCNFGSGR